MFKKEALIVFVLLLIPFITKADTVSQLKTFFIDNNYDIQERGEVSSELKAVSEKAYFYVEYDWYNNKTEEEKELININLEILTKEFDDIIYPKITAAFGEEWIPGIDNDDHITVLFHELKEGTAGYFRNEDEYPHLQSQYSNEREMIYLNVEYIFNSSVKVFLAHEFVHLVTFNQKERLKGIMEDVWLNEARAEFAIGFLGYNDDYENSNLKQRVRDFLAFPNDPLLDWRSQRQDYGTVTLFLEYLKNHYGSGIISDSLKSKEIGIASLEESFEAWNINKTFADVFMDWIIASFLNDCQFGESYCYKNDDLKNLRVTPSLIFIPSTYKTSVSLDYSVQPWSGQWYRVVGGDGDLRIIFEGKDNVDYRVSFVICKSPDSCEVGFLDLQNRKGEVYFSNFGSNYKTLTIIPIVQSGNEEESYSFSLSIFLENKKKEEEFVKGLLAQIAELQRQIKALQAQLSLIPTECGFFFQDLYFGQKSTQIKCLQDFLIRENVYPEKLTTGYFGFLTEQAVIRFQEKYSNEILSPFSLLMGNGYVGRLTRFKMNSLIEYK